MTVNHGPRMQSRAERRLATLYSHLDASCGISETSVTLPVSRRTYTIRKPSQESIDAMFATAPPHLQPFWTRIWPSGIALADVVLERRDELHGERVLELGTGLGVTAAASTEAGATVTAADFSGQALAFCRLNTLMNTGNGLRTLPPLDWRAPTPQASTRLEACGTFKVVMAADVLYESGDIIPLMKLIDRVLEPDGVLWLAEPGRRTAQRFLYRMAEEGWRGVSSSIEVPSDDDTKQTVNVHLLRRPADVDWFRSSLGGWTP